MNGSLAERIWTVFVCFLFAVWFIASVVHQFRFKWWSVASRCDPLHLLPCWSFFAPNPGRHDFHVVFRDGANEGHGAWTELATSKVETRWRWLWNPSRYPNKAVSDLTSGLYQAVDFGRDEPRTVLLSGPYISLLHVVMVQPPSLSGDDHRQFAVLKTHGFGNERQLEIAFLSEVHRANV